MSSIYRDGTVMNMVCKYDDITKEFTFKVGNESHIFTVVDKLPGKNDQVFYSQDKGKKLTTWDHISRFIGSAYGGLDGGFSSLKTLSNAQKIAISGTLVLPIGLTLAAVDYFQSDGSLAAAAEIGAGFASQIIMGAAVVGAAGATAAEVPAILVGLGSFATAAALSYLFPSLYDAITDFGGEIGADIYLKLLDKFNELFDGDVDSDGDGQTPEDPEPGGGDQTSGGGRGGGTKPDIPDNPIRYDPLALDLNHNGKIDTTSINGSDAYFDIDGNDGGIREHMGWLGGGDGFLVQDLNGNGKVDGISELFGSYTVNAFDDLKNRIDSNGDGIIDAKDDLFNTLQVWIDSNGNGVTDEGELHSLASLGITSIDTNKEIHTIWDGTRNVVNSTSSFTQNGEEQLAPLFKYSVKHLSSVYLNK